MVDASARLLLAALLCGVVGLEREIGHHRAGLRTHMIVGLGSALFAVVGADLGDSRVTAQIVTGIGFLGAGAIMHRGPTVVGLTTAGGLWVTAAIGVTAGVGSLRLATVATVILVGVLLMLRPLENAIHKRDPRNEEPRAGVDE
jgi:putative Mg2+ transporter-C (MgtC) family protein